MKKNIIRKLSVLLLAGMLSTAAGINAGAYLVLGDYGTEVKELQRMLYQTGYLFEEPDGMFGDMTKQAVRDFQADMGLTVDGVAGDETIQTLRDVWRDQHEEPSEGAEHDEGWQYGWDDEDGQEMDIESLERGQNQNGQEDHPEAPEPEQMTEALTVQETEAQTEKAETEAQTEKPETEARVIWPAETETENTSAPELPETEAAESESVQTLSYDEKEVVYPDYCSQANQALGGSETDYCKAHVSLHYETDRLMLTGKADDAEKACEIWKEEVIRLYDEWAAGSDQALQGMIVAAKAGFLAQYDMEKTALMKQSEKAGWAENKAYQMLEKKLRNQAAWLCPLGAE